MFDFFKKNKSGAQKIVGVQPTARVLRQFIVLNTFWSPDLSTEYVKNQIYKIREGNTVLPDFAKQWEAQGRIKFLED